MKFARLWLALAILFLGALSCSESQHSGDLVSEDFETLQKQALSVLEQRCANCHGPGSGGQGGINYILDVDQLKNLGQLVPGEPASSRLYTEITSGEMPPGGAMGSTEKEVVRRWIIALEDTTPDVFFADVYSQVFSVHCVSCHGSSGGINLTTRTNAILAVLPGNPLGSLLYDAVLQERMPKNTSPLSAEHKLLIYNWIKGGAR